MKGQNMWYQAFEFYDRQPPATEGDMASFRAPLPEAERADALRYLDAHAAQLQATAFCLLPPFFHSRRIGTALAVFRQRRHLRQRAGFRLFCACRSRIVLFHLPVLVLRAQADADCL